MKNLNSKIPLSVWAIGFAGMLINISTVMVFGIAAQYIQTVMGLGAGFVIRLEGFFEATAYVMKLFSGVISDYLRRRKSVMVLGFVMVTIARPLLAIFESFTAVFLARTLDRIGNGIQSTPRDALVNDLAPENAKGACFGLRQSLAVAGSFLGSIVGIGCMFLTDNNFRSVFMYASIPAIISLCLLLFFVKDPHEKEVTTDKKPIRHPLHFKDLKRLGRPYWILMIVVFVFMSARVGESVLVIHAVDSFGMDRGFSHAILILYNGMNSLCSYPIGKLSDRLGRYWFLALSFVVLMIADAFLGLAPNIWVMLIGVALWGIQIGMSQSMFLSIIADTIPEDLRGTGIGFFYLINAAALYMAGMIGGHVADMFSKFAMFITSGVIGAAALVLLLVLRPLLQVKAPAKA